MQEAPLFEPVVAVVRQCDLSSVFVFVFLCLFPPLGCCRFRRLWFDPRLLSEISTTGQGNVAGMATSKIKDGSAGGVAL